MGAPIQRAQCIPLPVHGDPAWAEVPGALGAEPEVHLSGRAGSVVPSQGLHGDLPRTTQRGSETLKETHCGQGRDGGRLSSPPGGPGPGLDAA